MDADKLIFMWSDFTIFDKGQNTYALHFQGQQVSERKVKEDAEHYPPYSAFWIGDIIYHLVQDVEAEGVLRGRLDILEGLANDLLSGDEMLDTWTCKTCGRQSFAVPDDQLVCVWCGTVADG